MSAESLADRVLDALDDAPPGAVEMSDGRPDYQGQVATIQWLSARLGVSDNAVRTAVRGLHADWLVWIWDVFDPDIQHRRLMISAVET